ncbi:MAG: hypothetical protein JW760_00710 [Spirochaetales bacterium]|nr:hypothetical protein [Spirochaetales bacterium]
METGYIGETFTHPGGSVSVGIPVVTVKGGTVAAGLQIGAYIHPRNHVGFFALSYGEFIRPERRSFGFSLRLLGGYYHTWPDGPLYTNDGTGGAMETPNTGRPHLGIGLDAGWRFPGLSAGPFIPIIRIAVLGEYPYNGYLLPHLAVGLGFTGTFGHGKTAE